MENILEHRHYVFDSDPHFSIDPITRVITNQSKEKTKLIQYDHNSERFTFEIPRYVEGHDMSLSNRVEIHYINISGSSTDKNEDVYICEDKQLNEENGDKVVFSWLISRNATIYAGKLNFLVKFICSEEDKITYAWNTAIFTDITIANGMNNGEPIVEEYSDILQQWYDKLISLNVVDKELSLTSENPVQNKVITEALDKKLSKVENGSEDKFLNEKGEYVEIKNCSDVKANPTEAPTEDLSKLKVGETVYAIPKEILQGTTAPTTETVGELGQFYTDTTSGTSYQCKSIVEGVYTWVEMVDKNQLDTKITKPDNPSVESLLRINANGSTQLMQIGNYSGGAIKGRIPAYVDATKEYNKVVPSGILVTGTPTGDGHAANKKYVDDAIANVGGGSGGSKSYLHTFTVYGDLDGTTNNIAAEGYFYSTSQSTNMFVINGDTISINASNLQTITSNILVYDSGASNPIGIYVPEQWWYFTIQSTYTLTKVVDVATEV